MSCAAEGPIRSRDPRAKLVSFIGLVVVGVSMPSAAHIGILALFLPLLVVSLLARFDAVEVLKRLLLLAPFALVAAAVPLVQPETGMDQAVGEMLKALLGCAALAVLSATTPTPELLAGLGRLGCPRLVVMMLEFMVRFGALLADEAFRLRRAAAARGYAPVALWQAGTVGRLVGALFLRSHARAERVHGAMLARGFDGVPLPCVATSFGWGDALFVILILGGAVAWRLVMP